jgi:phospholipid-binding lipoprotein MlaA
MVFTLRYLAWAQSLFCALLLCGCAIGELSSRPNLGDITDPLEKVNRAVFDFNQFIDRGLFRPAAVIYQKRTPEPLRLSVRHFFENLSEPTTVLNDILQGKGLQAINDGTRFAVNTTLGVFGLLDVATLLNLPRHQEDYGQTLAQWGVPTGPYLVLPILGPSNARDALGKLPALFLSNPLLLISNEPYFGVGRYGLLHTGFRTLHAIDLRARALAIDPLVRMQVDPYTFLREGYHQSRLDAIYDQQGPSSYVDTTTEEALFND